MAVASLVLGILALVGGWIPVVNWFCLVFAIVGLVLGVLGRKDPEKRGMATAGMVMSIIALALDVILLIACSACTSCGTSALSSLM